MAMMSDEELLRYRNAAEANSIHASDEINSDNQRFYEFYSGCPIGNEVEGESGVISTDVYDVVESVVPSLVRTFLGSRDVMRFAPLNTSEMERKSSHQKTAYINWLIREQPSSYKTIFDWIKGACLYKYSAVNFGARTEESVRVLQYEGISDIELAIISQELQKQLSSGSAVEVDESERKEQDGLRNVEIRIKSEELCYFVDYIDPERFVITRGATSVEDAEIVGHDDYKTKSDLVQMGYDKDVVRDLPHVSMSADPRRYARLRDEGGPERSNSIHWTGEIVKLETRYLRADRDDDGIAERLKVVSVGTGNGIITNANQNISSGSGMILEVEPHEIAPYAMLSSILMPGQAIGKSLAEVTMQTQLVKTTLYRQTMMNMYNVNSARMAINGRVNKDDLLTNRPGGIVRVKGDDSPQASITPLPVPFIGDKALMVMQYADSARAQRTGTIPGNQALDSDKLHRETATRFQGVQDVADSKVELIARGFAETGFRELFVGMLWVVSHFQKDKMEIMVSGEELSIDPRMWLSKQHVVSSVGIGAGDDSKVMENMSGLLGIHEKLASAGSNLTDSRKIYNVLERIVRSMNEKDVSEFFNNPDIPEELLLSQVEQLSLQNQQLQLQVQGNPLAEAEQIRAQADILEAQAKQQLDIAKLAEEQRQFNIEAQQKQQKMNDDIAAKLTELELKYSGSEPNNPDVRGSLV